MKKEAVFWDKGDNNSVECNLCPHNCKISDGNFGICQVRKNEGGILYSMIYGSSSSIADDPIEKKPLNHFYPGTLVLSLGSVGCNLKCLHCQNYNISTANPLDYSLTEISAEKAVRLAIDHGCMGIAWTYNEPTIWYEYTFDSAKNAKKQGLYTVYVSNGFINEDPLRRISPFLDAINVDVKSFSDDFYKQVCKARLSPVLRTCELSKKLGIHLEITYLVIPGRNDSFDEIKRFCSWVVDSLDADVPVYFSRFHPSNKMQNVPATSVDSLIEIYNIAKDIGISYVYLGNILNEKFENTLCPKCNNLIIRRCGFNVEIVGLKKNKCSVCGNVIPIITD